MIPLRDDSDRVRRAPLAFVVALAAGLGAPAALIAGAGGWTVLLLLVDAAALWVFGAGLEGAVSRFWLLVAVVFGGAGGAAIAVAAGSDAGGATLGAAAATGAALETVAMHLMRLPGVRVMSLVLVPWFGGFAEVRATIWGAAWCALAVVLIALGALGG